jgi:chloramphenicol-sensitive protein RarD
VVVIGYPLYFMLRRRYRTDHLGGLWFDLLFMLPLATAFALSAEGIGVYVQRPLLGPLLLLLACISAGALVSCILSSRLLPLGLFGLPGYVEPVLLVAVALLLGERMVAGQVWTYGPIWLAVGLLVIEGLRRLHRR